MIAKIFINFFPRKDWTHILSRILSKYVVVNVWWVATNTSFTSFNQRFALGQFFALGPLTSPNLGHFFAQGPLTSLNLNILAIWVRDPWVSIQINFWESVPPIGEVPHTCKIIYYFNSAIYFTSFFALSLLTSPNLNIVAIWVRDPLVSI